MPTGQKAKSYKENMEYKRGNSWKAKLKYNVDRAIWSSITFDEFLMKMQEAGYEIRQGKYLAFRAPDQKHFTNVKTLGAYYAEDSILRRLEKVYRACREVIRGEKDAPNKALYRKQHQAEYQLHDVTLKELAELGIHKLPSAEKLQRQQMELEEELASAKKEKQDLQKQQKTLQVIENNFDAMIREAGVKVPVKEPSQKSQEEILS